MGVLLRAAHANVLAFVRVVHNEGISMRKRAYLDFASCA